MLNATKCKICVKYKKIKDGKILSLFKGDQLYHFLNCNLHVGSQLFISLENILQILAPPRLNVIGHFNGLLQDLALLNFDYHVV
jgi:hypothetical protein